MSEEEAAAYLLSAEAVRERSGALFARIEEGASEHFSYVPDGLGPVAERVAALARERFPDLLVPPHARWRHFEVGGHDRFGALAGARGWQDPALAARAAADLAIVSVLLDAGAGDAWRFHEPATGETYARSEGLAVASFAMFAAGSFSSVPADPLRVDQSALVGLTREELASGFQASADNPLAGLDGRLALLCALGEAVAAAPDLFASEDNARPGGIVDALAARAEHGRLPATAVLEAVLEGLGPIWPSRITLAGVPLGDAWRHPALGGDAPGSDIVPFHKLSTWLSLSLIEPLELAGVIVTDLDALPGLAEYRNGGLFVDAGVLALKQPDEALAPHGVEAPLVVEWRAATVTLLDRLLPMVREALGVAPDRFTLASMLEAGTWLAGRRIAREKREGGGPPIAIISDGTVF